MKLRKIIAATLLTGAAIGVVTDTAGAFNPVPEPPREVDTFEEVKVTYRPAELTPTALPGLGR